MRCGAYIITPATVILTRGRDKTYQKTKGVTDGNRNSFFSSPSEKPPFSLSTKSKNFIKTSV